MDWIATNDKIKDEAKQNFENTGRFKAAEPLPSKESSEVQLLLREFTKDH